MQQRVSLLVKYFIVSALIGLCVPSVQAGKKPNILVIMADDIGSYNLSAYSRGVMGYRTPNIDSLAKEGALFTDHYGQPSCTAGLLWAPILFVQG